MIIRFPRKVRIDLWVIFVIGLTVLAMGCTTTHVLHQNKQRRKCRRAVRSLKIGNLDTKSASDGRVQSSACTGRRRCVGLWALDFGLWISPLDELQDLP